MKIAFLAETFSPAMGYLQNTLPKYFARHGAETHLITSDLQPMHEHAELSDSLHAFTQKTRLGVGSYALDGYQLHVLPHKRSMGYVRVLGLREKLREIRPEVIQTMTSVGWMPLDAALARMELGCALFTANHNAASTFFNGNGSLSLKAKLVRYVPGRMINLKTQKCYAVTQDCAEIAHRFLGVPSKKVQVQHLGTDLGLFFPVRNAEDAESRKSLRKQLGIEPNEILCIYTGKVKASKRVPLLVEAVQRLREAGLPFRALVIGNGPEVDAVRAGSSVIQLDFMPFPELGAYYRASDIGVWPGDESISMLDCMACGVPIVISDKVADRRHAEGNGRVFQYDNREDLERVLRELADPKLRRELGVAGVEKARLHYNVENVALERLADYRDALKLRGN